MIKRICLLPLVLCLSSVAFGQATGETTLVPGQPVEREITGGESHTYQITLASGQFVRVVVEQRGMDVKLSLAGADGKSLIGSDLTGIIGVPDSLAYEAAAAGTYQLVIRANGGATLSGAYAARLEVKASASDAERKRIAAESLLNEARGLTTQGKYADPQLSEKLGQALASFRQLEDWYLQGLTLNLMGNAYSGTGQFDKAIAAYEEALTLWRTEKLRAGEATLLGSLGYANYSLRRHEKALEYLDQALVIRRELKDRQGEENVLANLGHVNFTLNRFEKAAEYFEQVAGADNQS